MSWSRRRVLAGLGAVPWLGCAAEGSERRPPRVPATVPVALPSLAQGRFTNGAGLYVATDPGVPLVAMAVAVAAGHHHERPGEEGWATVTAKMLLEGMEGGDRVALLERYGELGATPQVGVSRSWLALSCTVHRDDAPAALRLMLDNLRRPTMDPAAFERVRREQTEALRAAQASPEVVVGLGLLLASHGIAPPAAILPDGTPGSLRSLTIGAVRDWLPPRVQPDTSTFALAGDVDEPQAATWIDEVTRGWSAPEGTGPEPPPTRGASAEEVQPQIVLVRWPQLPQAVVAMGGPRQDYGHRDEPAQALADDLMAGLMQYELRSRQRISYGVQQRAWATKRGAVAQLWSKMEPARVGTATRALWDYLGRFEGDGRLSPEVVTQEQLYEVIEMMHEHRGAEPLLGRLLRLVEHELPVSALDRRMERLESLDADTVTAQLRRIYDRDEVCVCVAGDETALQHAREVFTDHRTIERTPAQLFELSRTPRT